MNERRYYRWLHEAVAVDALVVTSSRRLARELRNEYGKRQIASGRKAWQTPDVHFWQDWLRQCHEEFAGPDAPRLIDPATSVLLWEQCLGRGIGDDLLSASTLVRHAQRAWQRIYEWRVPLGELASSAASRDEHWFAEAAVAYRDRLNDSNWLDPAQLAAYCNELIAGGFIAAPSRMVYAGFDRLTPALEEIFSTLQQKSCAISAATDLKAEGERQLRSYATGDAMWRAAGRWARDKLDENSSARLAIVAPDLDADAAGIARLVREGFAPGWQLGDGHYRASVDVSYGQALSEYPAIAVAMRVLRLAAGGLSSGDISILLRTSFLGSEEAAGRNRLETFLRAIPDRHWLPASILEVLRPIAEDRGGVAWCDRMQAVADSFETRNESRSPDDWARSIDELLAASGWPGSSTPDSAEFQLINRWRQLLNELAQLDSAGLKLTLPEAVRRLGKLAGETVYQPEAQAGGLRLLGMLEAAGLEFDCLWIGGMDASRWPPTSHPLALVNRKLQRDRSMPDSTPADTLLFARRTLERLQNSAHHVDWCWARADDEKEQVASPLLKTDANKLAHDVDDPGWYAMHFLGASRHDIAFDKAPAVAAGETLSGGAYTVQRMREEPFAAFAAGRLHVNELEMFRPGLTPRLRGTIVHDALHQLLRDRPTQEDLKRWDAAHRDKRIEQAAWRSLAPLLAQSDAVLQQLLQLEKRRLQSLLAAFLDSEKDRDGFKVEAIEHRATLQQGPVKLDLRIDRLDRLDDGSLLIIDYKAGAKRPFMSGNPKAPAQLQLCVYARALQNDSVGGLAFFYIDSREIIPIGEGGSIPWGKAKVDDWSGLLEEWCSEVDALLARFAAGDIGVNTAQDHEAARPLAVLSRIAEIDHAD